MSYEEFRNRVLKEDSNEYWFEKGILDERQRIIKLLEPWAVHLDACSLGCYKEDCSALDYQHAIDMITEIEKHDPKCFMAQGKFEVGCTCEEEQK